MASRPTRRRRWPASRCVAVGCAFVAPWVQAQGTAPTGSRHWAITPYASIEETLTDNGALTRDKEAESITRLTAGLRASGRSARVRGSIDYAISGVVYANDTRDNEIQNALRAQLRTEPVENWLTIDANAFITQQTISAFGVQSPDPALRSDNRTETRTFNVMPAVHGKLAGVADYRAWASYEIARTDQAGSIGNRDTAAAGATLGYSGPRALGWAIDLSHRSDDYERGRSTELDSARASLIYKPRYDLQLSASAGSEWTDQITLDRKRYGTWGVGVQWTPSPRTRLSAQRDERYFGAGYHVAAEHRFQRSMVRLAGSRDVQNPYSQSTSGVMGTAYDLLFAQLAPTVPDEGQRDQLVRSLLRNAGIDPSTAVNTGGYLANASTLVRRWDLSYVINGARSSLGVGAGTSDSIRASALAIDNPDLLERAVIRQRHWNAALGHRLTPTSGLSLDYAEQRTLAAGSAPGNTLRTLHLRYTTSFGPRVAAALEARHVEFDHATSPYTENALVARLGVTF